MPEKWTGDLIGVMHNNRITLQELGDELGICKGYVSAILNGRRNPPGVREKMQGAVDTIIKRKKI